MNEHNANTTEPEDRGELHALEVQLAAARPAPPARFRGALRRRLTALGPPQARPPHLWRTATLYAAAGVLLMAIGALSVAGIGPLAS